MRKNTSNDFWQRVQKTEHCWLWNAALDKGGYGEFYVAGRSVKAHRYSYEQTVGPIPPELELDHICHNQDPHCVGGVTCKHRACVNPSHLEPVTGQINCRRGKGAASRSHCPQGHPYDDQNTYHLRGRRYCRICIRARVSEREKRIKRWLTRKKVSKG